MKSAQVKTPSNGEKIAIIILSLTIIISSLYLGLKDNSLSNNELKSIFVTLKDDPEFDVYQIKGTTYKDIILRTDEYQKEFKIISMTYKATDKVSVKTSIVAGDKVELMIKVVDMDLLNESTYFNNYNTVYGLKKGNKNYINLIERNELQDADAKWAYSGLVIGLTMLPYGFINGEPKISLSLAVVIVSVITLIVFFYS